MEKYDWRKLGVSKKGRREEVRGGEGSEGR